MKVVKGKKTERFQLTLDLTREPELRRRVERAMATGRWHRLAQFTRVCVEDFVARYEAEHPELREPTVPVESSSAPPPDTPAGGVPHSRRKAAPVLQKR